MGKDRSLGQCKSPSHTKSECICCLQVQNVMVIRGQRAVLSTAEGLKFQVDRTKQLTLLSPTAAAAATAGNGTASAAGRRRLQQGGAPPPPTTTGNTSNPFNMIRAYSPPRFPGFTI